MKEFEVSYEDLFKGLRPYKTSSGLTDIYGLELQGNGYCSQRALSGAAATGLWPRVFSTDADFITVTSSGNVSNLAGNIGSIATASALKHVQFMSAGGVWLLTAKYVDGSSKTYIKWSHLSTIAALPYNTDEIPVFGCGDFYNGQLVVGGYSTGVNRISWSGISRLNFKSDVDLTAGWAPIPWKGTVWHIKRFGNGLAILGTGAVGLAIPISEPVSGYVFKWLNHEGIYAEGCATGDESEIVFVNKRGQLVKLTSEGLHTLGFEEFILPIVSAGTFTMTFDPGMRRFFISTGTVCYVLHNDQLYRFRQNVASIAYYNNSVYGVVSDLLGTTWGLTTGEISFGAQSLKSIEGLGVDYRDGGIVTAQLYAEYSQGGGYIGGSSQVLNNQGTSFNRISGARIKASVIGTEALESLTDLKFKVKLPDKRNMRGVVNANKPNY